MSAPGAVDLSRFLKPNRAQARAMVRAPGAGAGEAKNVVMTRIPKSAMIWLGFDHQGPVKAVKLTPDKAREIARSLDHLADEADTVLERLVDEAGDG